MVGPNKQIDVEQSERLLINSSEDDDDDQKRCDVPSKNQSVRKTSPRNAAIDFRTKETVNLTNYDTTVAKLSTALFYALCSLFITIVNKSVLTSYVFPSFKIVALGQLVTTVVVLYTGKKLRLISFPNYHRNIFFELMPLPFIYLGNMVFGLGGTKELSLPMFTMLRRFSILMTMIAEYYVLHIVPNRSVKITVGMMIGGAVIAALNDLGYNFQGYLFVLLNNFLTAVNGVYTKKKLDPKKEMGKYGLMFYSSLFMLPVTVLFIYLSDDYDKVIEYEYLWDVWFQIQFTLSCCMGFILNYSIMLCTQYNSALTTTIIGCLKNILLTYLGMFIGGDYVYSINNFIGINISIVGSILYTIVTFKPTPVKKQPVTSVI
uniref:UDP-sugar transporter UST74c n=1 Tax=Cacopsylla melanoneura TaxID=428564 RepID=A0A8D9BZ89_9HEMI